MFLIVIQSHKTSSAPIPTAPTPHNEIALQDLIHHVHCNLGFLLGAIHLNLPPFHSQMAECATPQW